MSIPLDPKMGGRSIGPDALQTADVLVSTTTAIDSLAIKVGTMSPVSHTRLYIGGEQVVEAVKRGVVMRSLTDALAHDSLCVAYRKPDLAEQQAQMARDFAGQQLGKEFGFLGIGGHAVRIIFTIQNPILGRIIGRKTLDRITQAPASRQDRFFCSHLVLAAYVHAGVPLTDTPPNWGTPGDVAQLNIRGVLEYVGHLRIGGAATAPGVVVGLWEVEIEGDHYLYTFSEGGAVRWSDKNTPSVVGGTGTWVLADALKIRWASGNSDSWKLPLVPDGTDGAWLDGAGKKLGSIHAVKSTQ